MANADQNKMGIDAQKDSINALPFDKVAVHDERLKRQEGDNRAYLMELTTRNLLYNYELEAAITHDANIPGDIHGGWESPTCQLRGHFLGHWLSAAAMHYAATGDRELKAKADVIVDRLAKCQEANGGSWVASIPEKYLYRIARGREIWAPHYTIHKTFMGLVDMYRYAGNRTALSVADHFADWFYDWSSRFDRDQMDDILDFETGGMLEIWVQLYDITRNDKYKKLMERYYRQRLFTPLINGEDPLTNMHANTTIPEVIAAAEAYNVTGEERYKDIVTAYWNSAVTERGTLATGGQTNGEIWGPKKSLSARLGLKTQEHCTVYNMMRLADYLFRWTGEAKYMDYIERNLYNGVLAQTYWHWEHTNGYSPESPDFGLIAYFLPMRAGARKGWGSKFNDFFCCHGSMVQANAALNRYMYYQADLDLYVTMYFDSDASFTVGGKNVTIKQRRDLLTGSFHLSSTSSGKQLVNRTAAQYPHNPDTLCVYLQIETESSVEFTIHARIPEWIQEPAVVSYNDRQIAVAEEGSCFVDIREEFHDGDTICISMKMGIQACPLPDDENMVAFMYGPEVLAGLCDEERMLYTGGDAPEHILVHENEREWGNWKSDFKTVGQPAGIHFIPLNRVGYENYCVYFPIKK